MHSLKLELIYFLVPYAPYFDHVGSYTSRQDDPNVLILTYEELSRDTPETVRVSQDVQLLFNKNACNSTL